MDSAQDSDLAPFLRDLRHSAKLYEIKPPLAHGLTYTKFVHFQDFVVLVSSKVDIVFKDI